MQDEEFKNIIRKKAESFEIPHPNVLNSILAQRENAAKPKRKWFMFIGFAALISVLCIALYMGSKKAPQMIAGNNIKKPVPVFTEPNKVKKVEPSLKIKSSNKKPEPEIQSIKNHTQNFIANSQKKGTVQRVKENHPQVYPITVLNSNIQKDTVKNTVANKENKYPIDIVVKKTTSPQTVEFAGTEQIKPEQKDSLSLKYSQTNMQTVSKTDSLNYTDNLTGSKPGLHFSLTLYGNYLPYHNITNAANSQEIKNLYPNEFDERAKLVFLTGFLGQLHYKNFTISSGIAYSEINFDKIYSAPVLDSVKSSVVNQESIGQNAIDQRFGFIEIPILLAYKLGNKKINFSVQGGIALQWMKQTNTYLFTKNQNEITYVSQNEVTNKRFNKFQYLFTGSVHINYAPFRHLSLFAGPLIRLNQKPLYMNTYTIKPIPVSGGIESGIKFNF